MVESSVHPYDVLEAEPEIVSGYYVDYGGVAFMVIYLGEGIALPDHEHPHRQTTVQYGGHDLRHGGHWRSGLLRMGPPHVHCGSGCRHQVLLLIRYATDRTPHIHQGLQLVHQLRPMSGCPILVLAGSAVPCVPAMPSPYSPE